MPFRNFGFQLIGKTACILSLFCNFHNGYGQSTYFDSVTQLEWPYWIQGDTQNFIRNQGKIVSNSLPTTKHSYGLKFSPPDPPKNLLFTLQLQVNINLSSTNSINWGLCDSQNNYLALSIGNSKDQLICTLNDSVIYSSSEKLFDISRSTLIFRYMQFGQNAAIEIHTTTDSLRKIKFNLPPNQSHYKNAYFSITQFGKTAIGQHELTNIGFSEFFKDTLPPKSIKAIQQSNTQIKIYFNEDIKPPHTNQFKINNLPVSDVKFNSIERLAEIIIPQNKKYTFLNLEFFNIEDEYGNKTTHDSVEIPYIYMDTPFFQDVYFTEIMFDANPNWGYIPEGKYIEILNRSSKYFMANLLSIKYNGETHTLPNQILVPGAYYTLSAISDSALKKQGNWIGLSRFPSISSTNGSLQILSINNQTIDELTYNSKQHNPELSEGGISLEKTNFTSLTNHSWNWISNNQSGGSPGQRNSNNSALKKNTLIEYYQISDTLHLLFSDLLTKNARFLLKDLKTGINHACYHNWGKKAFCSVPLNPSSTQYSLKECYSADSSTITDTFTMLAGLDSVGTTINEIMYNNYSGNTDFVEMVNNQNKPLKLADLYLEILDADGNIRNNIPCKNEDRTVILPSEFLAFSSHSVSLKNQFFNCPENQFVQLDLFPNLLSTGGRIRLRNQYKTILDEVTFTDKIHSPWIEETQGYSLEKLSPKINGNDSRSWSTSAIMGIGGTPGKENSVVGESQNSENHWLRLTNSTFLHHSNEPLLIPIGVSLPKAGFIFNVNLYNAEGSFIQNILQAFPLPAESNIPLNLNTLLLPSSGNYILKFEALHPEFNVFRTTKRIAIVHK